MQALMVRAAQALQCAKPERGNVTLMVFAMVDDISHCHATLELA